MHVLADQLLRPCCYDKASGPHTIAPMSPEGGPSLDEVAQRGRKFVQDASEILGGAVRLAANGPQWLPPWRLPWALWATAFRKPGVESLFALHAAVRPDDVAIIDDNGSCTYADLDNCGNRLANAFSGALPNGRLAFLLPNCREAIYVLAAAAKIDASPVPINTRFQREELLYILECQGADAIVVDGALRDRVEGFPGKIVTRGDDLDSLLAASSPQRPRPLEREDQDEARLVIHTSGTTGRPKGAERNMTDGGIESMLAFFGRVPVRPDDVIIDPSPLFHALGVAGVALCLAFGATLVLMERFDPLRTLELIQKHRVTAGILVPVMLRRICALPAEERSRFDLDRIRWILCSGAALPQHLERKSREVFGPVVRNMYGSTEAGWVSVATPRDSQTHPGTVGKPIPGVHVEIVDPADGNVLPPGEVGEIVIRSRAVFAGYTQGQEAADQEADDRWRTEICRIGDLGWLDDDGYLFVADRVDDMVVTGGENVYPAEVERVLDDVAGIAESAVVGVDDEEYGKILVAFVVAGPNVSLESSAIKAACRERIANYKVPKHVWVIDALPYTATGKVLRRELRNEATARLETASDAGLTT